MRFRRLSVAEGLFCFRRVGRVVGSAFAGSAFVGSVTLFFPTGVIARVDVVKLQGRHSVDLNYYLSSGHGVVVHARIKKSEAAGTEGHHLALVETVSHADLETSGDHRYVLAVWVPMRRNPISIRHL